VTSNCWPAGGVTGSPGETVLTGDGAATPIAAAVPCGVSGAMVRRALDAAAADQLPRLQGDTLNVGRRRIVSTVAALLIAPLWRMR
jgi:hypothetical protein